MTNNHNTSTHSPTRTTHTDTTHATTTHAQTAHTPPHAPGQPITNANAYAIAIGCAHSALSTNAMRNGSPASYAIDDAVKVVYSRMMRRYKSPNATAIDFADCIILSDGTTSPAADAIQDAYMALLPYIPAEDEPADYASFNTDTPLLDENGNPWLKTKGEHKGQPITPVSRATAAAQKWVDGQRRDAKSRDIDAPMAGDTTTTYAATIPMPDTCLTIDENAAAFARVDMLIETCRERYGKRTLAAAKWACGRITIEEAVEQANCHISTIYRQRTTVATVAAQLWAQDYTRITRRTNTADASRKAWLQWFKDGCPSSYGTYAAAN